MVYANSNNPEKVVDPRESTSCTDDIIDEVANFKDILQEAEATGWSKQIRQVNIKEQLRMTANYPQADPNNPRPWFRVGVRDGVVGRSVSMDIQPVGADNLAGCQINPLFVRAYNGRGGYSECLNLLAFNEDTLTIISYKPPYNPHKLDATLGVHEVSKDIMQLRSSQDLLEQHRNFGRWACHGFLSEPVFSD